MLVPKAISITPLLVVIVAVEYVCWSIVVVVVVDGVVDGWLVVVFCCVVLVASVLVEGEAKNQRMMDSSLSVNDKDWHKVWTGKTTCHRVVNFIWTSPRNILGKLINVKIIGATGLALQGQVVNEELR